MSNISSAGGVRVGGHYDSGSVSRATSMVCMTPESIIALCGMQLAAFDSKLSDRMAEKDSNMKVQESISEINQMLGGNIQPWEFNRIDQVAKKIDEFVNQYGNDPRYSQAVGALKNAKSQLMQGADGKSYEQLRQEFQNSIKNREEYIKQHFGNEFDYSQTSGLFDEQGNINKDFLEQSPCPIKPQALVDLLKNENSAAHRIFEGEAKARAKMPKLSESELGSLTASLGKSIEAVNARNDEIMMEMQSLVSQRSTAIQVTSNMSNALLEASKSIAQNIGR